VVQFVFYPLKLKKQPFLANNFKIQGQGPPFRRPCSQGKQLQTAAFASANFYLL